jgi:diguanylate cyclase (GGDEF)-like protein
MQWVYIPFMLTLLISAAVSGMLALYSWGRRSVPGSKPFAAMMVCAVVWSILSILETQSADLASKQALMAFENIGVVAIPFLWVVFASAYTAKAPGPERRYLFLLSVMPVLFLILMGSNSFHHLIISSAQLANENTLVYVSINYGPLFWIWNVYALALLLLGFVYLIQFLMQTSQRYSPKVFVLFAGVMLPWIGNGLYVLHFLHFDPTPAAYSLLGLTVALSVFRSHLMDVIPVARAVIVENLQDGVVIFNQQDRLLDINPAARQILALSRRVTSRMSYRQVLSRFPDLVSRYADHPTEACFVVKIEEGDEESFYDVRISPIYDVQHHVQGKLVVLRDISEHKRSESELEKSHALLESTLEATADGILVIHGRDKSVRYNRKFLEMWRIPPGVLVQVNEQVLMGLLLDQMVNPAAFYRLMNKLSDQPDAESYDVLELKDGRVFERYSHPQRIGEKRVGRVWSFRDITEQRRAEDKLRYLSNHDILTGLYNRMYFEEEINRLENGRQFPISMIMADVDGLKQTNDQNGHQAGDALLRKAAEILRQACRAEDVVARIGGDEFGILLPHSDANVADHAIQRIHNMMAMARVGDKIMDISLSLGTATAESGQPLRKALQLADQAMYQAKNSRSRRRSHSEKIGENSNRN